MSDQDQDQNQDQNPNQDPQPDEAYATKVFVITTICVVLYVGSVITFIL